MTTTKYASWAGVMPSDSPADFVHNLFALYAARARDKGDYDLAGIEQEYRNAVNALLPGSLHLVGDSFVGEVGDTSIPKGWAKDLRELVSIGISEQTEETWMKANERVQS